MIAARVFAILAALSVPIDAWAQDATAHRLLPRLTVERILEQLRAAGATGEIRDDDGTSYVFGRTPGGSKTTYSADLVGCRSDRPCTGMTFRAAVQAPDLSLERINRWNREGWFVKVVRLDGTNDVMLYMDVPASKGATDEMLAGYVHEWVTNFPKAHDFVTGSEASVSQEPVSPMPPDAVLVPATPAAILAFINGSGLSAELARDDDGTVSIALEPPTGGSVHFADCEDAADADRPCQKMYLKADAVPLRPATAQTVFDWSSGTLWNPNENELPAQAVAYLESDGRVVLILERVIEGGVSSLVVTQDLAAWRRASVRFGEAFR